MKKTYVTVQVRLIMSHNDDIEPREILENMDYDFSSNSEDGEILNTEIKSWTYDDVK